MNLLIFILVVFYIAFLQQEYLRMGDFYRKTRAYLGSQFWVLKSMATVSACLVMNGIMMTGSHRRSVCKSAERVSAEDIHTSCFVTACNPPSYIAFIHNPVSF